MLAIPSNTPSTKRNPASTNAGTPSANPFANDTAILTAKSMNFGINSFIAAIISSNTALNADTSCGAPS